MEKLLEKQMKTVILVKMVKLGYYVGEKRFLIIYNIDIDVL